MNLGEQLRTGNLKRALEIVDSLPKHKDELGGPRYSRNKELAKWQAAAVSLAQEVRRLSHNTETG
jgi:hypothetical protein